MAGTLTVQNLQGPSTGANANKILIPSGQTLYAPGHVMQVVNKKLDRLLTNSSTFADIPFQNSESTLDITPVSTNSKILVLFDLHIFVDLDADNTWRTALVKLLRDGSAIDGDTISYTSAYGTGAHLTTDTDRYMTYSTRQYLDSPSTTSAISYKLQGASKNNDSYIDFANAAFSAQGSMTLMEIAG